jgi:hypothetical protein
MRCGNVADLRVSSAESWVSDDCGADVGMGGNGLKLTRALTRAARVGATGMVLALATACAAAAAPPDRVFTVGNYPVSAVDSNAVAAKEKALAEGQKAAFRSLLKRIVPVTAYKQLARLNAVKADALISGVSVRSERNSSTEYLASLDFSFQADAVRDALTREGIAFVDQQAEPVTVVTVMRTGNPAEAKPDTSTWHQSWKGLDLEHTVTPVKLEALKPEIHNDTVNMLLTGDDNGMRIVAGEYKSGRVVLAVVEPDLSAKKMTVTLAGQDAVGPLLLSRVYRISDGDVAYASELAAVVALGVLEGRWKAVKAPAPLTAPAPFEPATTEAPPPWLAAAAPPAGGDRIGMAVEFTSLAQWNEIRTQLLDTPGVDSLDVMTVSARNADIALSYPGGAPALANAIGARGLSLTDAGGAGWVLRSRN